MAAIKFSIFDIFLDSFVASSSSYTTTTAELLALRRAWIYCQELRFKNKDNLKILIYSTKVNAKFDLCAIFSMADIADLSAAAAAAEEERLSALRANIKDKGMISSPCSQKKFYSFELWLHLISRLEFILLRPRYKNQWATMGWAWRAATFGCYCTRDTVNCYPYRTFGICMGRFQKEREDLCRIWKCWNDWRLSNPIGK